MSASSGMKSDDMDIERIKDLLETIESISGVEPYLSQGKETLVIPAIYVKPLPQKVLTLLIAGIKNMYEQIQNKVMIEAKEEIIKELKKSEGCPNE